MNGSDDVLLDAVKNANKLGLPVEQIPFSYKNGQDGREKDGIYELMVARQPEGLHMFGHDSIVLNEIKIANIEEKAKEQLKVLHKRLGYIRVDNQKRTEEQYQTNRRKFEAVNALITEREARRFELNPKLKKPASLIFLEKANEKKRLAAIEENLLIAIQDS